MGLIAIEGMQFYAHHGYYHEEQKLGGHYQVDVYVQMDLEPAAVRDELELTLNYEEVYALVREEMEERTKLIENVGHRVLDRLMAGHTQLSSAKVRITKLNPPLKGYVGRVFIELERKR